MLSATGGPAGEIVTVLHYDLTDDVELTGHNDPQQLADTFRDDVVPKYAALFNGSWTVQPVIVEDERDPQAPTAPRASWVAGVGVPGSRVIPSDGMPPGICGVATLKTDHLGRRFTGRIFLPGTITEEDQSSGTIGSAITTLWQTFLTAIPRQPDIAGVGSTSTANWCVYSRTQRAADLDPYASHVQATIIRPRLHYLRSRGA